jgi:hypothetical protein
MYSRIFEPVQDLSVIDGMKGGTPAILYDLCLVLHKLYSEPTRLTSNVVWTPTFRKQQLTMKDMSQRV